MPAVNPCLHFASLEQYNTILSLNSISPSLLTTLPPFPNCHLAPLTHLSHIATPLHSHTFHIFLAHYSPTFPGSPPSQRLADTSNIATFFH